MLVFAGVLAKWLISEQLALLELLLKAGASLPVFREVLVRAVRAGVVDRVLVVV